MRRALHHEPKDELQAEIGAMEKKPDWALGVCVIIAACVLVWGQRIWPNTTEPSVGRYQYGVANENNVFVLDTKTGRIWRKFVSSNSGPSEWQEDKALAEAIAK